MFKRYFIIMVSLITIIAYFDLIDSLGQIDRIIAEITSLER